MGFDVYGIKAKSEKGEYFRNNVWWWRQLWQFVSTHCADILTPEDINEGSFNDGHEYSEEKATAIALRLKEKIKDGTAKEFSKAVSKEIDKAKRNNKGKKIGDPGYNWLEPYPFTISNLREFATFAENSGGFTIC